MYQNSYSSGITYNSGWRVLDKSYNGTITLVSATTPENFKQGRAITSEYILSSGRRKENGKEFINETYNPREWNMYENKYAKEESAHCMTYEEAHKITNSNISTSNSLRNIGSWYLLASSAEEYGDLYVTDYSGKIMSNSTSAGIRIVLELKDGVEFELANQTIGNNNLWNIKD